MIPSTSNFSHVSVATRLQSFQQTHVPKDILDAFGKELRLSNTEFDKALRKYPRALDTMPLYSAQSICEKAMTDAVFAKMLGFLPYRDALSRCRLISRSWNRRCHSNVACHEIQKQIFPAYMSATLSGASQRLKWTINFLQGRCRRIRRYQPGNEIQSFYTSLHFWGAKYILHQGNSFLTFSALDEKRCIPVLWNMNDESAKLYLGNTSKIDSLNISKAGEIVAKTKDGVVFWNINGRYRRVVPGASMALYTSVGTLFMYFKNQNIVYYLNKENLEKSTKKTHSCFQDEEVIVDLKHALKIGVSPDFSCHFLEEVDNTVIIGVGNFSQALLVHRFFLCFYDANMKAIPKDIVCRECTMGNEDGAFRTADLIFQSHQKNPYLRIVDFKEGNSFIWRIDDPDVKKSPSLKQINRGNNPVPSSCEWDNFHEQTFIDTPFQHGFISYSRENYRGFYHNSFQQSQITTSKIRVDSGDTPIAIRDDGVLVCVNNSSKVVSLYEFDTLTTVERLERSAKSTFEGMSRPMIEEILRHFVLLNPYISKELPDLQKLYLGKDIHDGFTPIFITTYKLFFELSDNKRLKIVDSYFNMKRRITRYKRRAPLPPIVEHDVESTAAATTATTIAATAISPRNSRQKTDS